MVNLTSALSLLALAVSALALPLRLICRGDTNTVTVITSNSPNEHSVIADSNNNAHINIINGCASGSTIDDSSASNASSTNARRMRSRSSRKEERVKGLDNKEEKSYNDVSITMHNKLNQGSSLSDNQNNGHFNLISGNKGNPILHDHSSTSLSDEDQADKNAIV